MIEGVYWRGRVWRIAGGDEGADDPPDPTAELRAELEAARSRLAELEQATGELETLRGRVGELEGSSAAAAAELEQARSTAAAAQAAQLEAHRRALVAEHGGNSVTELIRGSTVEELDSSVELARTAYGQLSERIRAELAAGTLPNGGGERNGTDAAGLSPLAKIVQGLSK